MHFDEKKLNCCIEPFAKKRKLLEVTGGFIGKTISYFLFFQVWNHVSYDDFILLKSSTWSEELLPKCQSLREGCENGSVGHLPKFRWHFTFGTMYYLYQAYLLILPLLFFFFSGSSTCDANAKLKPFSSKGWDAGFYAFFGRLQNKYPHHPIRVKTLGLVEEISS